METFPVLRKIIRTTGTSLALMECMYSLIMAFIIITSVRFGFVQLESKKDFIMLLFGVLFTWGAVDAILFYCFDNLDQKEMVRTLDSIRGLPEDEAVEKLMSAMDGTSFGLLEREEKERICREAYRNGLNVDKEEIKSGRKSMLFSALGCWTICTFTLILLIIPVLLFDTQNQFLIASSFIASAILFVIGYLLAGTLNRNRLAFALALTLFTWIISFISMLMGG